MGSSSSDDFSVVVLASDLGIDARPFLSQIQEDQQQEEEWHDCAQHLSSDEDFSDLDFLQFFSLQGSDKAGNRIFRIVGKYFPAPVVSGERLKKYIFHKICSALPEGPFCIVYMHSTVQTEDNYPGLTVLRWIYEDLPSNIKDRLQVMYFIHPGLWSRLTFATLGRFFLSGGLYWKIKYVSRLQYLWNDIKKGEVEIPEFVQSHDDVLEDRPLTDYGIEPDRHHLTEAPMMGHVLGRTITQKLQSYLERKMGCSKSKNSDGTEIGYTKSINNDQEVNQSRSLSNCATTINNGQDDKKSAMKKGNGRMGGAKKEKHVRFVEEKLTDSEDEPFYSAEEDLDTKKPPHSIQKNHAHND